MRLPREVLVVAYRPGPSGEEFLVLRRSAPYGGYWHLVSGGVESGETERDAAIRELREETGLEAVNVVELHAPFVYPLGDEPERQAQFAPGVTEIAVEPFAVEVAPRWEPELNFEHDEYRWCLVDEAVALLRWPEPRELVSAVAREPGRREGRL